jgi:hypothetical protein
LLPNRFRRPLLTPVSQAHAALRKYSYHERVVGKVTARLRGTAHRSIEGGVVKIRVRY